MKTVMTLVVGVLCFSACLKDARPTRPATAMEYCEQLRRMYFDGQTECSPVTGSDQLTLFQATEAAVLRRRGNDPAVPGTDRLSDVGWVAYAAAAPDVKSMGGLLQLAGRQLSGLALLEVHNDTARVGVYVIRGQISAAHWDQLDAAVAALTVSR